MPGNIESGYKILPYTTHNSIQVLVVILTFVLFFWLYYLFGHVTGS